ncbi:cuticle protein-like protein [Euroglyphus maynei]|uniref:Cuticle protein-like protein n=1 Tax=Euroglyphus maynei TaxID=6958 RepID=A0A1Y3AWX2_EURMA|nr:cuticle protein-like protein [Euroglyphus maynei]
MKSFAVLLLIHGFAIVTIAFPLEQNIHYLPYSFGYQTADGQTRQEQGQNGVVTGSFSYTDANGHLRQV